MRLSLSSTNYPRHLAPRLKKALIDTPVVLVSGPRQAGKTTLLQACCGADRRYLSLDDTTTLTAAIDDPEGLIRGHAFLAIDEVQRAPGLLLAIKKSVDDDRRPGRFLITGSANLMTLPKVADALVGRMESLMLPPLADCEIHGGDENPWIEALFANRPPEPKSLHLGSRLVERVLTGGYPESVLRTDADRRAEWARQYLETLVRRDARELAGIEKVAAMEKLLALFARTSGQLCNYSGLGAQTGLDHKTVEKYLSVFEQMFLLRRLTPWSSNAVSRLVKTPKLLWWDSGLLAAATDTDADAIAADRTRLGALLENHVHAEILKHCAWSSKRLTLSFYREKGGAEVDFVLENARGDIVGIEVKSNVGVNSGHFDGLRRLASAAGESFKCGVILHDGERTLPMGDKLWAVPLSILF